MATANDKFLEDLKQANAFRWTHAKVTRSTFDVVAARLLKGKAVYQTIEAKTGVPWFIIAVIHEREASGSWNANLGQGDPFNRVTVHVPKGRGPFKNFVDAAVDALVNCDPHAARNRDWSPGGSMTLLERYNGLGYANKGRPSPYVWAGTDQYVKGKYTGDGKYDPNVVDQQLGCAGLLLAMAKVDPSVKFGGVVPTPAPAPAPPPPLPPPAPAPVVVKPPAKSWWGTLLGIFSR